MTDIRQDLIARFVNKHDFGDEQMYALFEEVGELAATAAPSGKAGCMGAAMALGIESEFRLRTGDNIDEVQIDDVDALAEELADVVFVARGIAEIYDINLTSVLNETARENIQKNTDTDGHKITKDE
jgi:NTP pyrophosphatase (non-canonical NTP hydrolase)